MYKSYQLNLRYDTDKELIDFIEKNKGNIGVTAIVRDALNEYVNSQK